MKKCISEITPDHLAELLTVCNSAHEDCVITPCLLELDGGEIIGVYVKAKDPIYSFFCVPSKLHGNLSLSCYLHYNVFYGQPALPYIEKVIKKINTLGYTLKNVEYLY